MAQSSVPKSCMSPSVRGKSLKRAMRNSAHMQEVNHIGNGLYNGMVVKFQKQCAKGLSSAGQ
jgi:hypothetical protein